MLRNLAAAQLLKADWAICLEVCLEIRSVKLPTVVPRSAMTYRKHLRLGGHSQRPQQRQLCVTPDNGIDRPWAHPTLERCRCPFRGHRYQWRGDRSRCNVTVGARHNDDRGNRRIPLCDLTNVMPDVVKRKTKKMGVTTICVCNLEFAQVRHVTSPGTLRANVA